MKTFIPHEPVKQKIMVGLIFIARPFEGAGTDETKGAPYLKDVDRIKKSLHDRFKPTLIFDPWEVYIKDRQGSFSKTHEPGRTLGTEVYRRSLEIAAAADLLVAFVPKRSMGTGDEMSAAARNGRLVLCITPYGQIGERIHNWTVISHTVYPDNIYISVNHFIADVESGKIEERLLRHRRTTTGTHLWLNG